MVYLERSLLRSLVDMDEVLPRLCVQCQTLITESPRARYEEWYFTYKLDEYSWKFDCTMCFVLACQVPPAAQHESVPNVAVSENIASTAISFTYTLHGNTLGAKPRLLLVNDGMQITV